MEAFGKVMTAEGQAALYFNRKRNRKRQDSPELVTRPTISAADGYRESYDITAVDAAWGDDALTTATYWTRDGVRFALAETLTRTLDDDDVGHLPGFESAAADALGNLRSISAQGDSVVASPLLISAPLIEAANGYVEGEDIVVTDAVWNADADTTVGYWTRDGVQFEEAVGLTRTLDIDDVGTLVGFESVATNENANANSSLVNGEIVEAA